MTRFQLLTAMRAIASFEAQINNGDIILPDTLPVVTNRDDVKWPHFISHNDILVPIHWDGDTVTFDGDPYGPGPYGSEDLMAHPVDTRPPATTGKPLQSHAPYRNNSGTMGYRILLCYKNFANECNVSHIGLGVTAAYTAKTLIQNGYRAEARAILGGDDLMAFLTAEEQTAVPVTHVLVMAQWIPSVWLAKLARRFPHIHFALNCHSNVGFLQAEPSAIKLLREAIDLEIGLPNFFCSCNNIRLANSLKEMYGHPVQFLPNLYFLHGDEPIHRPLYNGGMIRIGAFGSARTYKNFSTAVSAAMQIGHMLKTPVEIWMNSGRDDGIGNVVTRTAKAWTCNVPGVELKYFHWASWPEFRRQVGHMNLLLQPSYTETFNNVTADGVAEGVPSVVSDAIDWTPQNWVASSDDPKDVADVGRRLLYDPHAAREGYQALKKYVRDGLHYWSRFLARP